MLLGGDDGSTTVWAELPVDRLLAACVRVDVGLGLADHFVGFSWDLGHSCLRHVQ